jgi:hypothetical protein
MSWLLTIVQYTSLKRENQTVLLRNINNNNKERDFHTQPFSIFPLLLLPYSPRLSSFTKVRVFYNSTFIALILLLIILIIIIILLFLYAMQYVCVLTYLRFHFNLKLQVYLFLLIIMIIIFSAQTYYSNF